MRKRTRARELALQALYQIEVRGREFLGEALSFCSQRAGDEEVSGFATQLVEGCHRAAREIDDRLTSVAENWELPRMAIIDRCILRLALYEILFRDDIPPKVSINEAIELAKKYSTENSGTFVNGILDKVYTQTEKAHQPRAHHTSEGNEVSSRKALEEAVVDYGEADLHIHTICSDGTFTPEGVVEEAERVGLKTIAITDHDSLEAIRPAQREGHKRGIYVIPGIELSGYHHPYEVHILGLFVNIDDPSLIDRLKDTRADRIERVSAMTEQLKKLDIKLDPQDVFDAAGSSPPGRMHVAEALVKKGYCPDIIEAFQRYIGDNGPAYIPKKTLTPQQAIELILGAGGVPVFTHPGLTGRDDLLPLLVESGIQAIEVYYPTHTPDMVQKYLEMARRYNLVVTGGSDFHGARKPNIPLGKVRVPSAMVVALRERCLQKRGVPIAP